MTCLRLTFVALLLTALTPLLGPAAPAAAAGGACTTASGVTVVVSFGSLGGGTVVRCAHTSGTGIDALHAAGFSTEGTAKYGALFVCRLNGKPGVATEGCQSTPPLNRSWRYWYASNGGSWKFSQAGAASHTVIQGGFEGWSFGGGSSPGVAPVRSGASGGSSSSGAGAGAGVVPTGPSSAGDTALPKPKPRSGSTADPSVPNATDRAEARAASPKPAAKSGNSIAPWIAGALILALAAAAAVTQRRRARVRNGARG